MYNVIIAVKGDVINTTPIGLFYLHFIGGIFFVPSADELIFYYGLIEGNPPILSFLAALIGFLLAQILNYFIGLKTSSFILNIVSKKKVYKTRRFVNKYGAYGIFIFNVLPLPSPLLTFALGLAKYNFKRLFLITILAKSIEYGILIAIFLLFSI
ncbi:MAG: VTT domain-containing protein [Nanoarchaeota archaeon]|nr:VTT domain-containing protein [Nanoarchaeota archaeon]